jgi:hypothetical protein
MADGTTVGEILERVQSHHGDGLREVVKCSSLLLDGVAVHDRQAAVQHDSTLDVLPPFAGG